MTSPIVWFGGKGNMVRKLVPLIPPHRIYVEVFGGGASLLFAKKPSPVEVYNDVDSGLVNFFRVIRDPEKFARFYHLVVFTPWSREEYNFCRDTWEKCEDEVERAYRWFIVARMSFSGTFGKSWSSVVTSSYKGMAATTSKWMHVLEMLPRIHERVMRVQIENMDFRKLVPRYDSPDTFFYMDPPYVEETRRELNMYPCEMGIDDHRQLVDLLMNVRGKVMLSGYRHPVYEPLEEAGWKRMDFYTFCHAVGRTRRAGVIGKGSAREYARVESVWLSPGCFSHPGKQLSLFEEVR